MNKASHKHFAPLLQVKNLQVEFISDSAPKRVVDQVSFNIMTNEIIALVGESGSGKSVTAHCILNLLTPSQAKISGDIQFEQQNLRQCSELEMQRIRGNNIGMIFQEPMTALNPLHRVGKQIIETLQHHQGLTKAQASQRCNELLQQVEIEQPEIYQQRLPHQLSGGQRQRIMIAMALANQPKLLIADEPTTALDATIEHQLIQLLVKIQQQTSMAILLITHNLPLVKRYANRIIVMHQGQIAEQADVHTLFQKPQHPYTQMLLAASPTGKPKPISKQQQSAIFNCQQLRVWFPIKSNRFFKKKQFVKAVNNVDLQLFQGETLGIVGESGSGKSTLAQAIVKLIPSQGKLELNQCDLQQLSKQQSHQFRKQIQIVFQDPFASLNPRIPVQYTIAEGLQVHQKQLSKTAIEQAVIKTLIQVGIDPEARFRYPHEFSGGQRQRIAIARSLILNPKIMILDEPTSALDHSVQAQVLDLLNTLQQQLQLTYIFITHDLQVIRCISHRLLVMQAGHVVEVGTTEDLFHNPQHEYTKKLLSTLNE